MEETEGPRPPAPDSRDEEDVQAVLRMPQDQRQRQREAPDPEPPGAEEEARPPPLLPEEQVQSLPGQRLGPEHGFAGEGGLVVRAPAGGRKRGSEKPSAVGKTLEPAASLDPETPSRSKWSVAQKVAELEKRVGSGKRAVPDKTSVSEKRLVSEIPSSSKWSVAQKVAELEKRVGSGKRVVPDKTSVSEKRLVSEIPSPSKWSVSQKIAVLEKRSGSEKRVVPDKTSILEKKLVSEKAAIFEKTPAPETQPAPGRAVAPARPEAWEQPASPECPSSLVGQQRAGPEKLKSMVGPLPGAGGLPAVTLQVRTPSSDAKAPLPTWASPTFSRALQCSSPCTVSFWMSPQRDSSEAALTSSVKLPASSVKLGPKLKQYHLAIQRSQSVKCASPSRTEFLVAPVDVTSKRHLFEKELVGQSRESPASSPKEDLQLSGLVKSRLNLWISRTQESAQQGPQETQRESAAGTRPQWRKKPEHPLDAEV